MVKNVALFSLALAFIAQVTAHGAPPTGIEMLRRREYNALVGRSLQKRCGDVIQKHKARRMAKRSLSGYETFTKRDSNDSVCILTPEVTQGPYHILGELVRQNITQDQVGIPFEVDVDFIDISTCGPVSKVWVDSWSCNATGVYSGYEQASSEANTGSGSSTPDMSMSDVPSGSMGGTQPTGTDSGSSSQESGAYAGADSPDSSIAGTGPGDNDNFLRGTWQADDDGHLTMYSIVPGWYSGRAVHFHIKVYTEDNGSIADNGTFIAGSAVHTGQFFFEDEFMEKVGNVTPYSTNTIERLSNDDDQWYAYQNAEGYSATLDIAYVDESDITAGVIGSITVGLNLTYESPEIANYWWSGSSAIASSTSASEASTTA